MAESRRNEISFLGCGYAVRPTHPSRDPAEIIAINDDNNLQNEGPSTFHSLLTPSTTDTEDNTHGHPYDDGRDREREDSFCFPPQRITCEDFPTTWQPARRIITFMGVVSFLCTLLVVAIILIAVVVSKNAFPKNLPPKRGDVIFLVPKPTRLRNRIPTIVVSRYNSNILKSHISQLTYLLKHYQSRQGSASSCDLRYTPTGGSSCHFPLDRISDNCTEKNNFGYDSGNPCVAIVFNDQAGWSPQPFNVSNPKEIPEDIRAEYDPYLVYLTCMPNVTTGTSGDLEVKYSPFHGFPLQYLPSRSGTSNVLPLVMVQFIGSTRPHLDVCVTCSLWARNAPILSEENGQDNGKISFNLYIV